MSKARTVFCMALIVLAFLFVFVLLDTGQTNTIASEDQQAAILCTFDQGAIAYAADDSVIGPDAGVAVLNGRKEMQTASVTTNVAKQNQLAIISGGTPCSLLMEKWLSNRPTNDGLNLLAVTIMFGEILCAANDREIWWQAGMRAHVPKESHAIRQNAWKRPREKICLMYWRNDLIGGRNPDGVRRHQAIAGEISIAPVLRI